MNESAPGRDAASPVEVRPALPVLVVAAVDPTDVRSSAPIDSPPIFLRSSAKTSPPAQRWSNLLKPLTRRLLQRAREHRSGIAFGGHTPMNDPRIHGLVTRKVSKSALRPTGAPS